MIKDLHNFATQNVLLQEKAEKVEKMTDTANRRTIKFNDLSANLTNKNKSL
jgi:hypothetical protein